MPRAASDSLPLLGRSFTAPGTDTAAAYCAYLLTSLGAFVESGQGGDARDIARDWAHSGLLYLTGYPQQPLPGPGAIPSVARGALMAFRQLARHEQLTGLDGAALLTERAAFLGLTRQGQQSANGSCRLLPACDGWIALNLARESDWDLLPAWLDAPKIVCNWHGVTQAVAKQSATTLVERGQLIGLPVARSTTRQVGSWYRLFSGTERRSPIDGFPLVVDLSSLWAGPLCSHLLQMAGARVIKVESTSRLDGARQGNKPFYELLNAGKESVVLNLKQAEGRAQLQALIRKADIVIEASRPRALQQLGIDAYQAIQVKPGVTWISLTGYGRQLPEANWVAFGDDAAVAAGASQQPGRSPVFCGDALADPLTGIHAALAALAFWQAGGGALVDLSLCDVTAFGLQFRPGFLPVQVKELDGEWTMHYAGEEFTVTAPRVRNASMTACAQPGEHTHAIFNEFGISC